MEDKEAKEVKEVKGVSEDREEIGEIEGIEEVNGMVSEGKRKNTWINKRGNNPKIKKF